MATHITGVLLAALVIWQAPGQVKKSEIRNPNGVRIWALAGLALAGILAACQAGFTPPAVYHGGESQQNLPAINPQAVPLVGSPEAPYIVTLLFDYQCPHCQQMHFMLPEAIRRYGGKLAFALCPVPLERQCNPYIPHDVGAFKDSCALAKIGLAVWLANREAFPGFERWMFSLESGDRWRPRSLDAAWAKAVELVGQAKFDAAWADPWVDRYLQTSVRIYGDTGSNAIPKLVFGSRWVIPQPHDAGDLVSILQDTLAVPKPDPGM
jgi:protein-disulfide isomerase